MTQQSGFTCHVRTGENDDLLTVVVQQYIIGYILLAQRHIFLYHRVTSLTNVYHEAVVHVRAYILVLRRRGCKTEQAVELCRYVSIGLHHGHVLDQGEHQFLIDAILYDRYTVVGSYDLILQILKFGRYIPLGICQCLLACPLLGNAIFVRIAHLQVVSEHVVESYLQAANACTFGLAVTDTFDSLTAVVSQVAQLVEFIVHTLSNSVRSPLCQRRVGHNLPKYALAHLGAQTDVLAQAVQVTVVLRLLADLLHGLQCTQRITELHHLTRTDTSGTDLADRTLHILQLRQALAYLLATVGVAEEVFDHRLPVSDRAHLFERESHPAVEHTCAHGSDGLVQYVVQRTAVVALAVKQFEVTDGELVEPDILVGLQPAERMDMFGLQVLGYVQVVQYARSGYYTVRHASDTETLEVSRLKLLAQPFLGSGGIEHPILQFKGKVFRAEQPLKLLPFATHEQHLFRCELCEQRGYIIGCALRHQILAC